MVEEVGITIRLPDNIRRRMGELGERAVIGELAAAMEDLGSQPDLLAVLEGRKAAKVVVGEQPLFSCHIRFKEDGR